MSSLKVKINQGEQTALFSGSGTFQAKETIKRLGRAQFVAASKSWLVRDFSHSVESLKEIFPGIEFVEFDFEEKPASLGVALQNGFKPVEEKLSESSSEGFIFNNSENDIFNFFEEEESPTNTQSDKENIEKGLSVGELIEQIRLIVQKSFPKTIYVYGVLSNVKILSNGRAYLDLCYHDNPQERVSCVIWQNAAEIEASLKKYGFELENNLQVMFEVSVQMTKRDAKVSLTIHRIISEYTLAKLAAQREITNKKLKEEGIFQNNKNTKLPFLPKKLGILTSDSGTVIHDFCAGLEPSKFAFELLWLPVSVQGQTAKQEIIKGLKYFQELEGVDAILLFRGGGSASELAVFNDYDIAREICLSKIPILSAIGHQEDNSSTQDVSFLAFSVPKNIGDYFAKQIIDFRIEVQNYSEQIKSTLENQFLHAQKDVSHFSSKIFEGVKSLVVYLEQYTKNIFEKIPQLAKSFISNKEQQIFQKTLPLEHLAQKILFEYSQNVERSVSLVNQCGKYQISNEDNKLEQLRKIISIQKNNFLEKNLLAFVNLEKIILGSSPEVQLKRGFTMIREKENGNFVTTAEQFDKVSKNLLEIEFFDAKRDIGKN